MRKILVVIFTIVVAVVSFSEMKVSAVEPRYAYVTSVTSALTISSNTAYCKSYVTCSDEVTKIEGVHYLEKKNGRKWDAVNEESWTGSSKYNSLNLNNSQSGLGSGTYRVRAVFTVYCGSDSEEVEKISKEETI